jgi:hypothetical protein
MAGFPVGKGIEDYGSFNGGLCFRLNQVHPQTQTFIICAPDKVHYKLNKLILFLEN